MFLAYFYIRIEGQIFKFSENIYCQAELCDVYLGAVKGGEAGRRAGEAWAGLLGRVPVPPPRPARALHACTHTPVGGTKAPWQNPRKEGAGRRAEVSHRPRPQKGLCWLILDSAAGNGDSGG